MWCVCIYLRISCSVIAHLSVAAYGMPTAHTVRIDPQLYRYVKFDTFHPAVSKGLPVTRVISRVTLQAILAKAATRYGGPDTIMNGCHVVAFEESNNGVSVTLEDGSVHRGDILVGADGIWSKIRKVCSSALGVESSRFMLFLLGQYQVPVVPQHSSVVACANS